MPAKKESAKKEETKAKAEETAAEAPAEEAKAEPKKKAKAGGNVDKIIEMVETMTVLELSDLVKSLEDKFGVTAAAPMAMMPGMMAGGAPAAEAEEKTEFDVMLKDVGSQKIQVIKVVRAITGLGLKEAKALNRLPEVFKEVAITRKELGTPPLVTPTSQIVGVQAVLNVLFGKYKMVTNEVKDLVYGLYGQTPTPVDPEVRKVVLKGYKRGETPVTGRAADFLEPELEADKKKVGDLAKNDYDLLVYALYPTTGEQFLKWKYGLEEKPASVKPKTLEDIRKEDEAMAAAIEQVCKAM